METYERKLTDWYFDLLMDEDDNEIMDINEHLVWLFFNELYGRN